MEPQGPIFQPKSVTFVSEILVHALLTNCRITITIRSMPNGESAGRKAVGAHMTRPALALRPLPWPDPQTAEAASEPHAHRCLTCAGTYECRGPEETGYCAPVCQPCYWIELGAQLRIYREMVVDLERKRGEIEFRIGSEVCRNAVARRSPAKNDASLLVAFGNLMSTRPTP